jgi:acylphosphatase
VSDLPGMIARRLLVSGRVQGVGFRANTLEAATRLGLVGWVRNRPDGRVEVHAQAFDALVDEFERWLRQGPRWARVTGVSAQDVEVDEGLRGFEIRW